MADAKGTLTEALLGGVGALADPADFAGEAKGVEGLGGGVMELSGT